MIVSECDIGKLLLSNVNISTLSREDKYKILIAESNPNPRSYPRTRLYASGPYRQFNPAWLKQYPWLHYSRQVDGVFCRTCTFLLQIQLVGTSWASLLLSHFALGSTRLKR